MASVLSARNHGGLPRPSRAVNPFDSDEDEPVASSSSRSQVSNSSSTHSTRGFNPFDDDATSGGHVKSKPSRDHGLVESSNPFDDYDDISAKPSKHAANGHKTKPGNSAHNSSHAPNPFDYVDEVSSKPIKTRGDTILDDGSLFDDEEMPEKPVKERKSATRALASKVKDSGLRIKESASTSFGSVKLPNFSGFSGSTYHSEEAFDSKRGKAKQNSRDLVGEIRPGYHGTQQEYSAADQGRFADQSVEQLEQYAVSKSRETTASLKNAIKIAEDTKGVATTTLETLHTQGEQIRRTHETAVHVDEELGRGEKLLGTLGGIFSRTWKPKKAHRITGPQVDADRYKRKNNLGERAELGLGGETLRSKPSLSGMSAAQAQLEMEKHTQDEALSDLSNVLGQLKGMTLEMGNEIERQNGDLDRMHDDVHELSDRVKGANNRTRHLLGR